MQAPKRKKERDALIEGIVAWASYLATGTKRLCQEFSCFLRVISQDDLCPSPPD